MAKNYTSKPVTKTAGTGDTLNVPANYQFIYMHSPHGWELVRDESGAYEWLPTLKRFQLRPGVNGIKQTRRGGVDYIHAKARFESDGWRFISQDEVEGGYLVEYEGRSGPVYEDRFTTPRSLGVGANSRILWDFDQDAYDEFRRGLKEILGEPDPAVIDLKTSIQSRRAVRQVKNVHIPAIAAHVEAEQSKLDAMKASRPKRKRKPRIKAKKVELTP